jgi:hypothetical protein
MKNNPQELHLTITDYPETSVAECIEIPVIVEGKDTKEIEEKMVKGIAGYFAAFPHKKDEIFNKRRTITIPTPKM